MLRAGRATPPRSAAAAAPRSMRAADSARRSGLTARKPRAVPFPRCAPAPIWLRASLAASRAGHRGRGGRHAPIARQGMEHAVAVIGRALIAQPRVRLVRDLGGELSAEPRLADAGLAREQDDLAGAGPGLAQAVAQQGALRRPADEVG